MKSDQCFFRVDSCNSRINFPSAKHTNRHEEDTKYLDLTELENFNCVTSKESMKILKKAVRLLN